MRKVTYDIWTKEFDINTLIFAVLSNVAKGVEKTFNKVNIKPVKIKDELLYQFEFVFDKKVLHENLDALDAKQKLYELLETYFKQGQLFTTISDYQILFNKKREGIVMPSAPTRALTTVEHNRKKNYLIPEDEPCDFMIHLGVMDENGKVYKKKYDKFRQLNKYLEFVSDVIETLGEAPTIIDFGCGKAYLTFALYYYLVKVKGMNVKIIGLDLKEEVIDFCNQVAKDLNYEGLSFEIGDIKDYQYNEKVDMVVSLHACDTATDAAIAKAVNWNAKVIFAVPCCQHELFGQLSNRDMQPLLKHGVVKDKLATIVTDTLRTLALESVGYEVQMLEFIDMVHTPKNILIRAVSSGAPNESAYSDYLAFKSSWGVKPTIDRLLKDKFPSNTNNNY